MILFMKYASDTGALLSLACSRHFADVIAEYSIISHRLVIQELCNFAIFDDFLGIKAKLVLQQKLSLEEPGSFLNLPIEETERAVFSLAHEKKIIALTDDIHAARIATEKVPKLIIKPSFYLLLHFSQKKKISKKNITEDLQEIAKSRNWMQGAIWKYLEKKLQEIN